METKGIFLPLTMPRVAKQFSAAASIATSVQPCR